MTTNPFRTFRFAAVAAFASFLAIGCGVTGPAKLKGKLVDGGGPPPIKPGEQISLALHRLNADGSPETNPTYNAILKSDGDFEVIASGGELAPGTYRAVVVPAGAPPKGPDRFKGSGSLTTSKLTLELKPGANEITLDLAKPE